jgi:glycosyltransferase involved in cell wall biosynthesis
MRIWIFQSGEPLPTDSGEMRPMRAINLSNALTEKGHQVVLWSSDFDHFTKKHRTGRNSVTKHGQNLEIRLIKSKGYRSHISFSRLFDHAQLAWNLHREMKGVEVPDIAFVGYPPIEPAWVMTRRLKRLGVPVQLDVKDAWPEVLVRGFPKITKPFAKLILFPYFILMKQTFRNCAGISAPTTTFLDWALAQINRKRNAMDIVTPLTSQIIDVSIEDEVSARAWWESKLQLNTEIFRASFVGTFNSAFDFSPIVYAAQTHPNYQFVLAGDGPQFSNIKDRCKSMTNVFFPGWISVSQARVLYKHSDVLLAPLLDLPDFNMSIQNKFYDAMAQGIPIVTSIKGVARKFIEENRTGYLYENSPIASLSDCLKNIELQSEEKNLRSKKAKEVYAHQFTFEKVYGDLVAHLEQISNKL